MTGERVRVMWTQFVPSESFLDETVRLPDPIYWGRAECRVMLWGEIS